MAGSTPLPLRGRQTVDVLTAGIKPPFAINLRVGLPEAALTLLVNLTGLLAAHLPEGPADARLAGAQWRCC